MKDPYAEWKERTGWQSLDEIVGNAYLRLEEIGQETYDLQCELWDIQADFYEDEDAEIDILCAIDELNDEAEDLHNVLEQHGYQYIDGALEEVEAG